MRMRIHMGMEMEMEILVLVWYVGTCVLQYVCRTTVRRGICRSLIEELNPPNTPCRYAPE
jgi:hypothetical protein